MGPGASQLHSLKGIVTTIQPPYDGGGGGVEGRGWKQAHTFVSTGKTHFNA